MASSFLYKLHPMGVKLLTKADLGSNNTSHQTHIGLYQDILNYLDNNVTTMASLVYQRRSQHLNCYFDRIENPDGTFRSPKIRIGPNKESIAARIREIAGTKPDNDWYLLWSAMQNGSIVFWLIDKKSEDYNYIKDTITSKKRIIHEYDYNYEKIKAELNNRINNTPNGRNC